MADNTLLNSGTGGDMIATADTTSLNGGAVSGVKVQRTKPGYGTGATHRDVDTTFPLPVRVGDGTNQVTLDASITDAESPAPAVPASAYDMMFNGTTWDRVRGDTTNGLFVQVKAITPPTLTKGTQGATGYSTQDLKDAGRVAKTFSATFTAATTEALITLTPITDGTAGTAGTSFTITSGKRFRIQALTVSTRNAAAAIQGVIVNLRVNTAGATTATSPLLLSVGTGTIAATANVSNGNCAAIPDGLEILGNGTVTIGVSQVGTATANNTVTLVGYEY